MENNNFYGSFESACEGKKKFDTWREARQYAKKLKKVNGDRVRTYECIYCAHFHNGHDHRKMLKRLNAGKIKVDKSVDKRKQV